MGPRDLVVVGGSAGSLEPLRELAAGLPAGLPGSVLVTQHVAEDARSELPWLLSRAGPLPAEHAKEGERLQFLSPGETRLTRLACPDCGGALAEIVLPQITYYRCHVGHQFGPQSLAVAQAETAEEKLWAAVATLEETAALARHLAEHIGLGDDDAGQQARTADWAARLAEALRAQIQDTPGK